MSVDLHTHTIHSDGTLEPAELIDLAERKSLTAIAITDHDITSGNNEAIFRGKELGIKIIPGIELSVTVDLPGNGHLHILGLFIDPYHAHLNQTLHYLRLERSKRNQKILNRLKDLGKPVSADDLNAEGGIGSIGRPHIAAVMIKRGYVKNSREAFQGYLKKGAPAYFDRVRLSPSEAIDLIHLSGGIAIIAHPIGLGFSSLKATGEYILHLKKIGLDGIEAYCSGQNERVKDYFLKFARENDMVVSGGSDFHGSVKPGIQLGSLNISDQVYWDLLRYWQGK